jgi:hypothetical protein
MRLDKSMNDLSFPDKVDGSSEKANHSAIHRGIHALAFQNFPVGVF